MSRQSVVLLARAMVCINVCPILGLSRYKVETVGASKPVNHMEHTMTRRSVLSSALNKSSNVCPSSFTAFIRSRCGLMSRPSSLNFFSSPASSDTTTAISVSCIHFLIVSSSLYSFVPCCIAERRLLMSFISSSQALFTKSYILTAEYLSTHATIPLPR